MNTSDATWRAAKQLTALKKSGTPRAPHHMGEYAARNKDTP
jgi:hypothetical protein